MKGHPSQKTWSSLSSGNDLHHVTKYPHSNRILMMLKVNSSKEVQVEDRKMTFSSQECYRSPSKVPREMKRT